jgi:DNA modification methylase
MGAKKLGLTEVPCIVLDGLSEAQKKAYIIADNKLALNAGWDADMLKVEMERLGELGFDLSLTGFDDIELSGIFDGAEDLADGLDGDAAEPRSLADRFLIPPFSVLNAREGWWQERKRAWLAMGIESEVGRDIDPTSVPANLPEGHYLAGRGNNEGGSIFDPTLCELAYSWFSPVGGLILDPFAGGSVRGIVASKLGRQYIGVELREEQVTANRLQGDELCPDLTPVWHTGDSRNIDRICADVQADMVFSCPPYADLEVYSDNPNDLSTLDYADFKKAYFEIIKKTCNQLKPDSFACFVIGEVRDKKGNYYNFVGDTIQAFLDAGLKYYNEAILVTAVGSLPIRVGKQFESGRKLGKTHQNILVFLKGDAKKATLKCGSVEVYLPESED